MSDTLHARLLAEIERREEVARAATPGPWHWEGDYPNGTCPHRSEWAEHGPDLYSRSHGQAVITAYGYDASGLTITDSDADFITANAPDTVLAYLAALRGVVELHTGNDITCITSKHHCTECGDCYPCPTLRCVAEGLGVEG